MEKRFSFAQLAVVAALASAAFSGLTYWLTYRAQPRILYEQNEIVLPARPGPGPGFVGGFFQLRFINTGRTPAHNFHLAVAATQAIDYPELYPTLSGDDELHFSLSVDRKRLDVAARRFPPSATPTLRLWLTGEGKTNEVRFTSEEFGEATKVDSLEAALAPWYRSQLLDGALGALVGAAVGAFVGYRRRAFQLRQRAVRDEGARQS